MKCILSLLMLLGVASALTLKKEHVQDKAPTSAAIGTLKSMVDAYVRFFYSYSYVSVLSVEK